MNINLKTDQLMRSFSVNCHNPDHDGSKENLGCSSGELSIIVIGEADPAPVNHENHYIRQLTSHWYEELKSYTLIPFDTAVEELLTLLQLPAYFDPDLSSGPDANVEEFRARADIEETLNLFIAKDEACFYHFLKGVHLTELSKTPYTYFVSSFGKLTGPDPSGGLVKQALHLISQALDHILYASRDERFRVLSFSYFEDNIFDSYGNVKFISYRMDDGVFIDEIDYDGCYEVCDPELVCFHGWSLRYINEFVTDDDLFSEKYPEDYGEVESQ